VLWVVILSLSVTVCVPATAMYCGYNVHVLTSLLQLGEQITTALCSKLLIDIL